MSKTRLQNFLGVADTVIVGFLTPFHLSFPSLSIGDTAGEICQREKHSDH